MNLEIGKILTLWWSWLKIIEKLVQNCNNRVCTCYKTTLYEQTFSDTYKCSERLNGVTAYKVTILICNYYKNAIAKKTGYI